MEQRHGIPTRGGLLSEEIKLSGGGGSRFHSKALKNPLEMFFNRARTDGENLGYVHIRLAGGKPLQDLRFTLG